MTPIELFRPGLGPVHHLGYVVESIEESAAKLVADFGAGPFFALSPVPIDVVTSGGAPAEFAHNSAFGQLGGNTIELMEMISVSPDRARERFDGSRPRLHHVAWALPADDVGDLRTELGKHGFDEYLHGQVNEVDFTYHDATGALGHDLEILIDNEELRGFYTMFAAAADQWDGSDPLRSAFGES